MDAGKKAGLAVRVPGCEVSCSLQIVSLNNQKTADHVLVVFTKVRSGELYWYGRVAKIGKMLFPGRHTKVPGIGFVGAENDMVQL